MKTLVLEYYDLYQRKHCLTLPYSAKEKIFSSGLKIDASDVLGLIFVCESDFILKPIPHSLREHTNKEVYLCRVYDENDTPLEAIKDFWINKAKEELHRLGEIFIDKKYLHRKIMVKPISI